MLAGIVAGADKCCELTRLLQTAEKKIGDYGSGVRHEDSLVVAPLLCPPDEILRVLQSHG